VLATDPQTQFNELRDQLVSQIGKTFPIRDRQERLEVRVSDIAVADNKGTDDIRGQHDARVSGRTWAMPVHGTVQIVDLSTNKVLMSKRTQLATVPKMTRHYSYIIGGQEKFIANQWRLRPGVYVKETSKEKEYEAQFQLAKGAAFDIQQDSKGYLFAKVGARKVPLYSLLAGQGITDEQMKAAWGPDAFAATKSKAKVDKDLASFHTAWSRRAPEGDVKAAVAALFAGARVDPYVIKTNLGIDSDKVTPEVLLAASKKLVDVAAERRSPDPIDSLQYKELWQAKDHLSERLAAATTEIQRRVGGALAKPTIQRKLRDGDETVLREVIMPDLIKRPLYHAFSTSLASNGKQTNPLSMLSDRGMVTIMGPGGIKNQHAITQSNTAIDPSHLGILDPVFTPESNPGVNTHLAFGVQVRDRKPHVTLYNVRTRKAELVDAATAATSVVALPDQVTWKNGTPSPLRASVRTSDHRGDIRDDIPWSKVQYVMPASAQVFAPETNLVPFMQNDSAGRTTMSARHMAQAISIEGREAPMVQVAMTGDHTFEKLIGSGFLSHRAKADGTITEVRPDHIVVKGRDGRPHKVPLYNHYPTNDPKGMLHSTPTVAVGDKVKAHQVIADNNYTKNGVLALGTNLRVAYLANGSNHEDGVVISDAAAQKLRSVHLNKPSILVGENTTIGKSTFVQRKEVYEPRQLSAIGDDGLIKPGTIVKPGDPLVLALSKSEKPMSVSDEGLARKLGKRLRDPYSNASLTWDSDYEGEVVSVSKAGRVLTVHVKTREPAQVGSKVSTRHSAKGIVTQILPRSEMPHDERGRPVDVLLNSVSVPGRMNPGQILETAAGKIAEKTGKPYIVKNFVGGTDYLRKVKEELKSHGLKETETLYDPKTKRRLGEVTVGPHYVFQLEHQIDKKTHVRSGGPDFTQFGAPHIAYDNDTKIPRGGGHSGAQSLGSLGVYAALAAGLHHNLAEMQTLKSDSDQAKEVWGALVSGDRLPPPKVPFVYKKFEAMLRGVGVDLKKEGSYIRMMPRSDQETRALSTGPLTKASRSMRVRLKGDEQPERGGLFDWDKTGGPGGQKWSHIDLVEPMPNPVFAKAIAHTLGISERDIPLVIEGTKTLPNGGYGGTGFRNALAKIDVDKELAAAKKLAADPKIKGGELDKLNYKIRALQTVKDAKLTPDKAWTIQAVPVLPPVFRTQSQLPNGTVKTNPLNALYRRTAMINESLARGEKVPYDATLDARAGLYKSLTELFGTAPKGKKGLDLDTRGTREDPNKKLPGIIHMISGDQPKDGFFQDKLVGKKQDYTSRATIVVDPNLSVEEIGVPKKIASELMRPMVVRRLIQAGYAPDQAQKMVSQKHPVALKALENEVAERPILMKRDPVLHQYGLLGQRIKLTDEAAIKVSPLVLPPLGGDIDGDTIALMVPLTRHAVEEAKRIMPSQRTLSDSAGDVLYAPANESALALYRMSLPRGDHGKSFSTKEEAEKAFTGNKIQLNEVITIAGSGKTTLGRARLAHVVPDKYKQSILSDLHKPVDRSVQEGILKDIAKTQPHDFVRVVDGMSRLGFQMAYESGHTVALKDLEPLRKERGDLIQKTKKEVDRLRSTGKGEEATEAWLAATRKLHDIYAEHYKRHPNDVSDMSPKPVGAGIKAKREQFQGLVMAPMLVEDHLGRPSKVPVTRSFSEGVDLGGYFLQASGARRGTIQKVDSVREPGYMTKLLIQANIDQPITASDCGTSQGILMPISEKDVVDRRLAQPAKIGDKSYPAGTLVTPSLLAEASAKRVGQLMVRSPLKCRAPHGVCSHCMGTHPSGKEYAHGENVGVIAAQALGERAAQIMLKQTHGGGIVQTKGQSVAAFGEVQRLFDASKPSVVDAGLAPKAGHVKSVSQSRAGVYTISFDGSKKTVETRQKPLPHIKPGVAVTKGELLTHGDPNIWHLTSTRGIDAAQQHMVKKIGDVYASEGVLRRHVELAVRTSTGLVRVTDPGDHDSYLRGDYMQKPVVDEINRGVLHGKQHIKYEPVLSPLSSLPDKVQPDWMGRLQGENLAKTITRGVTHGQRSDLAGRHPIPRLAQGEHIAPRTN
jgi:DNA-directed RNA polymerase subunit beta'